MNKQEIFNMAVRGLHSQGWIRSVANGGCAYRGSEGRRCAWGWCVPDELYDKEMEGSVAATTRFNRRCSIVANRIFKKIWPTATEDDRKFANELQACHDQGYAPIAMMQNFHDLCMGHGLTWPSEIVLPTLLVEETD